MNEEAKSASSSPVPACPVCGSSDCEDQGAPAYRRPTHVAGTPIDLTDLPLRHWRCRACTYRFIYPHIPESRLIDCYSKADDEHWATDERVVEHRAYEHKRALLERFATTGRRALDFGCFDGGFLGFLGEAWERFGIEPSTTAARVAESRGVHILGSTIEEVIAKHRDLPPVDAILIFDVMEHLNDPVDTLRKLATLLRPGGVMMIETGDSDSPHFARAGKMHPYCGYVEHVGFFNKQSIARAGERAAGMELASFERTVHSTALLKNLPRAKFHNFKHSVLRALHQIGIPLGERLRNVAMGPVPRPEDAHDHFLAILKKPV